MVIRIRFLLNFDYMYEFAVQLCAVKPIPTLTLMNVNDTVNSNNNFDMIYVSKCGMICGDDKRKTNIHIAATAILVL